MSLQVEQQKYGEILMDIINRTNEEEIKTSEQLIHALVEELKGNKTKILSTAK